MTTVGVQCVPVSDSIIKQLSSRHLEIRKCVSKTVLSKWLHNYSSAEMFDREAPVHKTPVSCRDQKKPDMEVLKCQRF